MKNYPKEIFASYTERVISREEFIAQLSEWQRENGIDHSCDLTIEGSKVYFTYRNITAIVKNKTLHFRTYHDEEADTPFEFCRKVDFYLEQRRRIVCNRKSDTGASMSIDKTNDIPEKIVIKQVKEIIDITGIKLQRINTGCFAVGSGKNRRYIKTAEAGTCDFEGYDKCGRFVAIECKRSVGGRLSPSQKRRIEDINSKGGVAFVAHSGNEALALLRANNCI